MTTLSLLARLAPRCSAARRGLRRRRRRAKLGADDIAVVGTQHITQARVRHGRSREEKASMKAQGQTFPQAGTTELRDAQDADRRRCSCSRPSSQQRGGEARDRPSRRREVEKQLDRAQEAVLQRQREEVPGRPQAAGLHRRPGPREPQGAAARAEALQRRSRRARRRPTPRSPPTTRQNLDPVPAGRAARRCEEILVGKNKQALANADLHAAQGRRRASPRSRRSTRRIRARRTSAASSPPSKGSDVPEFDAAVFATTAKTDVLLQPVNTAQYGWFVIQPLADDRPGEDDAREEGRRRRSASSSSSDEAAAGDERLADDDHEELLQRRQDHVPGRLHARRPIPARRSTTPNPTTT